MFDSLFNKALKGGVEKGVFAQPKGPSGGTKLAKKKVEAKKPAAKPAAKPAGVKKPAAKKAAPKKATATKAKATTTATKKAAPKKATTTKKAPAAKVSSLNALIGSIPNVLEGSRANSVIPARET